MADEKKVRLAILGAVHDHQWPVFGHRGYLQEIKDIPEFDVVAYSDEDPEVRERLAKVFPDAVAYESYEKMLEEQELDAICLGLNNNEKVGAVEAAAARGIHIMMDKPMSATLEQARRMRRAAHDAGIIFMENSPSAWRPALVEAIDLAQHGAIGKVHWLRARMASPGAREHGATETFMRWVHDMEANGGGALTDYACYGIKYAAILLGAPNSVFASVAHHIRDDIPEEMEDDSVVIMEYDGARAVIEGSWSQYGSNIDQEVDPVNGGMMLYGSNGVIRSSHRRHYIEMVNDEYPEGTRIEGITLPEGGPKNGPQYFLECIRSGKQPEGMASAEHAYTVQRVMAAAYESARTGRRVFLSEPEFV